MIDIKIKKLHVDAIIPRYATSQSAGLDLHALLNVPLLIEPGNIMIIDTGISLALPQGYEGQVRPRSGLAAKNGITVLNSPGTIDSDYRGEIKVILINHGPKPFTIESGMRIAQLVISKHETISFIEESFDINETQRNSGGFGSTGI